MKRALIYSVLAILVLAACGKDEENANTGTNSSTANSSTNANVATNNTSTNNSDPLPMAGDCEWGMHIAACGVEGLPQFGGRAIGCRDFYEPSEGVSQDTHCDEDIWDETAPCSTAGLSGRRPAGCCYELDAETQIFSRGCVYDDPGTLEATTMEAQGACEAAGFCWVTPDGM